MAQGDSAPPLPALPHNLNFQNCLTSAFYQHIIDANRPGRKQGSAISPPVTKKM